MDGAIRCSTVVLHTASTDGTVQGINVKELSGSYFDEIIRASQPYFSFLFESEGRTTSQESRESGSPNFDGAPIAHVYDKDTNRPSLKSKQSKFDRAYFVFVDLEQAKEVVERSKGNDDDGRRDPSADDFLAGEDATSQQQSRWNTHSAMRKLHSESSTI